MKTSEKKFDEFEELVLELDMARILFAAAEEEPRIVVSMKDITERKKAEEDLERILKLEQEVVLLQRSLLAPGTLNNKLKTITDGIVRILGADFCRIWLIRPGDLCGHGCIHAEVKEGAHVCRFRDKCLHLMTSSGRYTHIDGKAHARVPFGCYKIGRVASGEEHKFLTNDVVNDPRVHNHEWARELGLVSFVGYRLRIPGGETIGVLALFAKHTILPADDAILDSISISSAFVAQEAVAEEKLKESESKYLGLFESSRDAIITIEPPSWKFTSGNPATMEMFRARNAEEFSKQGPWDLSPERQPDGRASDEKALEMIETAMRDGSHFFEWTHKRLDGEEFPATVLLTRMEQAGKVIIQATVRNIAAHKEMEKRLMTAERLAAVGTFVAGAGHELNNPLACVIGFSQLALSNLERGKPDHEELKGILEKVVSNADRCRAIVGSLLASERGYSVQLAPVDVHEVIDEAIELARQQTSFERIELKKDYSPDVPPVFANRVALLKVFVNVALNACQAMDGRGTLKVITEREGNWGRVIFKDSGVGIKKEDLHKVFDPFFSTKEVGKGAGLGLSVCIGIVKSHDGDITVQSDGEGKGTTVTIMLPIEKRGGYEKESR